jgi:hypothetical protein
METGSKRRLPHCRGNVEAIYKLNPQAKPAYRRKTEVFSIGECTHRHLQDIQIELNWKTKGR